MNDTVRLLARQLLNTQRQRVAIEAQTGRFTEDGMSAPSFLIANSFVKDLKAQERALYKQLATSVDPHDPIKRHIDTTVGLGPAVLLLLGLLPKRPGRFQSKSGRFSVGALNKYLGVYPGAKKRTAGVKLGYSSRLRAVLLERVSAPCMKMAGGVSEKTGKPLPKSPYRSVYDQRMAITMLTHPPMRPMGTGCEFCDTAWKRTAVDRARRKLTRKRKAPTVDCSNVGGPCWSDGHRHRDAIRKTALAIVLDLWLVDSGKAPVLGANRIAENRGTRASSTGNVNTAEG